MRNFIKRALATRTFTGLGLRRHGRALVVLTYHDLREDGDFRSWLRVAETDFERHLAAFARIGSFVDPARIGLPDFELEKGLNFALTFDDGYVNNRLAIPVLERHGAPALFFVSTGQMTSGEPFWSDVVVTPVQALSLDEIDLRPCGLDRFRFRRGDEAARWEDIQRLLVAVKAAGNPGDPAFDRFLVHWRDRFSAVLREHLPRFRPLTAAEIGEMAGHPLCRFGSHAHEHEIITRLDDNALANSLTRSRSLLREATGQPVEHFAYPNGDWDERTRSAVDTAGYRCAFTTRRGLARPATSLAHPRLGIGGFDAPPVILAQINRLLLTETPARDRP